LIGQERFAVPVCRDFPPLMYQRPMNKLPPSEPKKDKAAGNGNAVGNDTPAPDHHKA
jgi:hypothetical protein